MSSKIKAIKAVTPVGTAGFCYTMKPDTGREFSDDKYKVEILFDAEADLSSLEKAIAAALKSAADAGRTVPKVAKTPLKDGSERENERYHDKTYLMAKSNDKPPMVDAEGNPVEVAVWGGDTIRVALAFKAYPGEGPVKGVTTYLNAVQVLRTVPRTLSGVSAFNDGFDASEYLGSDEETEEDEQPSFPKGKARGKKAPPADPDFDDDIPF